MAKWEIHRRLPIVDALWWKFTKGPEIVVKWPVGDVLITEDDPRWDWTAGPSKYLVGSADPNDHYRPDLEKNIGRQGIDWNWKMGDWDVTNNTITIKFSKKHEAAAMMYKLKWS
jgi:hypothetical protein